MEEVLAMPKLILSLCILLFVSSHAIADDEMKIFGMPSIAFNSGNSFANFGGPNIKFEIDGYFGGLSFFPSLRHSNSANEWSPILGAGIFFGRKNIFLVVPSYYYTSTWYSAFGIGYKF